MKARAENKIKTNNAHTKRVFRDLHSIVTVTKFAMSKAEGGINLPTGPGPVIPNSNIIKNLRTPI
ncbi:MAG TPA: hypothetical protein V6D17_09365 [Candidatus Obscuribacterales bacterium]